MTSESPEPRTRIRTIVVFSMFFAVLGAVIVFAYFATFSRPVTTVILVRHAEKNIEPNNPDPDLSSLIVITEPGGVATALNYESHYNTNQNQCLDLLVRSGAT